MTPARLTGLALLLAVLLGAIQAAAPGLVGGYDGYYHVKLAWLMRQDLTPPFPWLPHTVLSPDAYVDHHWLYHIVIMPIVAGLALAGIDLVRAGQVAAVACAVAALLASAPLLRAQRVPAPELWALLMLGSGAGFAYRISMARAQSLSLLVLFIACHLLLARRHAWLVPLGAAYVWLYDAFPLLLAVASAYALARFLIERRVAWQPVAASAAGIALGLVVNPYFPRNLAFIAHHLAAKLEPGATIRVGSEWYPYTTHQLVENAGPALVALALGSLALALRRDRADAPALFAFLIALLFGAMQLVSRRFVEYFPPFAVVFLALAVRDHPSGRRATAALAAVALALAATSAAQAARSASNDRPSSDLAGAARWLAEHTPPGALVFQTDWDDFPRLFFYNDHNRYLLGLDPTFLARRDPARFTLWVDLTQGRGLDLSEAILTGFGARYAVSDLDHLAFLARAADDPELVEVYRDDTGVVYRVDDP